MATTTTVQTSTLSAVCKLRWVPKANSDPMTIENQEAIRLMASAIMFEEMNQPGTSGEAAIKEQKAMQVLEKELKEYLAGVRQTIPTVDSYGMHEMGLML